MPRYVSQQPPIHSHTPHSRSGHEPCSMRERATTLPRSQRSSPPSKGALTAPSQAAGAVTAPSQAAGTAIAAEELFGTKAKRELALAWPEQQRALTEPQTQPCTCLQRPFTFTCSLLLTHLVRRIRSPRVNPSPLPLPLPTQPLSLLFAPFQSPGPQLEFAHVTARF